MTSLTLMLSRRVDISRAATSILEEGWDVSDEFDSTDFNEGAGKHSRQREPESEEADSSEVESSVQPAKVHKCENPFCDNFDMDFKYQSKKIKHDQ